MAEYEYAERGEARDPLTYEGLLGDITVQRGDRPLVQERGPGGDVQYYRATGTAGERGMQALWGEQQEDIARRQGLARDELALLQRAPGEFETLLRQQLGQETRAAYGQAGVLPGGGGRAAALRGVGARAAEELAATRLGMEQQALQFQQQLVTEEATQREEMAQYRMDRQVQIDNEVNRLMAENRTTFDSGAAATVQTLNRMAAREMDPSVRDYILQYVDYIQQQEAAGELDTGFWEAMPGGTGYIPPPTDVAPTPSPGPTS